MDELDLNGLKILVSSGTTSRAAGAIRVFEALKNEVEKLGVKGIKVKLVGEKGIASVEPIVEVHQPGKPVFAYGRMTPEKALRVLNDHIIKGNPIIDWLIGVCDMATEVHDVDR